MAYYLIDNYNMGFESPIFHNNFYTALDSCDDTEGYSSGDGIDGDGIYSLGMGSGTGSGESSFHYVEGGRGYSIQSLIHRPLRVVDPTYSK